MIKLFLIQKHFCVRIINEISYFIFRCLAKGRCDNITQLLQESRKSKVKEVKKKTTLGFEKNHDQSYYSLKESRRHCSCKRRLKKFHRRAALLRNGVFYLHCCPLNGFFFIITPTYSYPPRNIQPRLFYGNLCGCC